LDSGEEQAITYEFNLTREQIHYKSNTKTFKKIKGAV
jgi:hypothetical protein